jgi:integrase
MAKILTALTCRNAKPPTKRDRDEIPDGGCPGLYLIVQKSGHKAFAVRFRFRGVPRKLTLGPFLADGQHGADAEPVLGAPLTLAAARELAARAKRQAKGGVDPTAERRKQRTLERAAESDTLTAVAQEYLRRRGPDLRTLRQRKADLELACDSPIGRLPIAEIRRGQYVRVLDHIADHNGPVRSDRVLSALKTLLAWHANRSDYVSVLGRGGRRTSIRERARTRTLSDDELRRVWLAAEQDKGPFGPFIRFTLLAATRRSESAGLHRDELTDGGATWVIPGSRYKSKHDTVVPLSKAAQKIVAAQPVLSGGNYVFSADGSRPLGGFDDRKKDFDKISGVSDYGLHDLRRTARTLLSRAGVNADIAERCLGHSLVGVRGTYDRHSFQVEKAAAFEQLAQLIGNIVRPESKVTALGEARAKRRVRR